jgi:hypothetical protein
MTDAQYDYIKETMPKWADKVEETYRLAVMQNDKATQFYLTGFLWGLAEGAKVLGMLSEADDFVMETIRRFKEQQEKGGE